MVRKNYYRILNIKPDSSPDTIKKAFRTEIARYHPDNNKSPEAKKRFEEIIEAFNVLSDPDKRIVYDMMLSKQRDNLPIAVIRHEEEQYREWQQASQEKSEKYWGFPLAELLLLDILIEPGLIEEFLSRTDDLLDDIRDTAGDIFDLF